jgi:hypothetical protein
MRAALAAIALLCLSTTVLAHDIYSNLRDRDGNLCCNGQDCMPVEATVLPDGNYYLPASDEIVPADMAAPSPDSRFHRCAFYPVATSLTLGVTHYGAANRRLDASLLRCILRSGPFRPLPLPGTGPSRFAAEAEYGKCSTEFNSNAANGHRQPPQRRYPILSTNAAP